MKAIASSNLTPTVMAQAPRVPVQIPVHARTQSGRFRRLWTAVKRWANRASADFWLNFFFWHARRQPWFARGTDRIVFDPDGWTIRSADGSRTAHSEHTIAITDDGPLVLTQHASRQSPGHPVQR